MDGMSYKYQLSLSIICHLHKTQEKYQFLLESQLNQLQKAHFDTIAQPFEAIVLQIFWWLSLIQESHHKTPGILVDSHLGVSPTTFRITPTTFGTPRSVGSACKFAWSPGWPCQFLGLHPTGLKSQCLPSIKKERTKERTQSLQQRHQWFNGWRTQASEARSCRSTPSCVKHGRQNIVLVFTLLFLNLVPNNSNLSSMYS